MLSNETHQLESRMRETRLSGSEGGVVLTAPSLPLSWSEPHSFLKPRERIPKLDNCSISGNPED